MFTWNVDARKAAHVVIRYVDAQGDPSVREILPLALEGELDGPTFKTEYINSHCYLAKASRTFRVDRVQEIADAATGEVLGLAKWLQSLPMSGEPTATEPERSQHEEEPPPPRSMLGWKLLVLMLLIGYVIGRFRLIRWVFHVAGKKWGLWL